MNQLEGTTSRNLLNAMMFNAVWLLCVLGGNAVAVATTGLLLVLHLRWVSSDWRELVLALQALVLGFFVDSLFLQSGVLLAPGDAAVPPAWLMCLWVAFSTTLNHSMAFLHSRPLLTAATGALLVPVSYYAGTRLTAFELAEPAWQSLCWIGFAWALVLPLLFWFAARNRERFTLRYGGAANDRGQKG